jgi:hypothetical protein
MDYFVQCECGKRLPVTASMAGGTVRCECDRSVAVPLLSKLRQAAGQRPFESGTIDTIRRMIAEGSLPPSRQCALTGRPTDDVAQVQVECERVWKRGPKTKAGWTFFALAFLIGIFWFVWLWLWWDLLNRKPEELGRDTVVWIPLRVCADQQHRLRRMGQWRLRRLLRQVPIYAQLLNEYPGTLILT